LVAGIGGDGRVDAPAVPHRLAPERGDDEPIRCLSSIIDGLAGGNDPGERRRTPDSEGGRVLEVGEQARGDGSSVHWATGFGSRQQSGKTAQHNAETSAYMCKEMESEL